MNVNGSPCRPRAYVPQLPQTPSPGLTVPPLQLHTSFSCLESDLWELFPWSPPFRPLEKHLHALCIPSSVGSGPGLSHTCQLFSGLSCFSLAPNPMSTSLRTKHLREDPQETPARRGQTGYVCLTLPPTLMFRPDFLILSVLLMNS